MARQARGGVASGRAGAGSGDGARASSRVRASGGDGEARGPKPPTMRRSRGQLATAYAPGALFTFEGGVGACMAVSAPNSEARLNPTTQTLIYEQIDEFVTAWKDKGLALSGDPNIRHPIDIRQTVERTLVSGDDLRFGITDFSFVTASKVAYIPFPLSFVCRQCDLQREVRDINRADEEIEAFKSACPCAGGARGCADNWEQLDVVLTHWSGAVEPLTPMRRFWSTERDRVVELNQCSNCSGNRFYLRRKSTSFSEWYFECVEPNCRAYRRIDRKDEASLWMLGRDIEAKTALQVEVNMEPVSYRASQAYYPQTDRLLVFSDSQWIDKLRSGRRDELRQFLGAQYRFPSDDLGDAEKERILGEAGRGGEWISYRSMRATLSSPAMPEAAKTGLRTAMETMERDWEKLLSGNRNHGSRELSDAIRDRQDFVRRYDPIRMAVEHRTFASEKLDNPQRKGEGKKLMCVDLKVGDEHLLPDNLSEEDREDMLDAVACRMGLLGIGDLRLVRDLEICEYAFGYSRTSPLPTVERDKGGGPIEMPVTLRLFDRAGDPPRHPVLCTTQENEAFYVRLDERVVIEWLVANGLGVDLGTPAVRLGARLIEGYPRFSRFLDEYRGDTPRGPRVPYSYVYTLLHTMAHQLIGVVSELSGLDLGSFGEHLFVPDLAFLIYRRGTTMDLGNLSSMWRNYGDATYGNLVLERMVNPETLRCGSETVCEMRGGACPDCVLIPETSCLTRNELLSRSVLTGRGRPKWDEQEVDMREGYYATARRLLRPVRPVPAAAAE